MGPEVMNRNKDCEFHGPYAGRDLYITMYQDNDRKFVVTYNANIKPVAYFTGRETELQDLRQRIEEGRKSVLVSGMGGIGKTHICRKLFEEYLSKHSRDENGTFRHIGYIEYDGDMSSSLQNCLKFKQQESPEQNQEAAWRELEYLASDGKLLLFVDNVDKTLGADPGLQRLRGIPGAVVLTSRRASFSDEFEPYRIGFLDMEQCKEIYEKIRYEGSRGKIGPEEVEDLEYIIENLAGRHTITVELLAHLARTKSWTVKKLREELGQKGFRLAFHKNGELVNIQDSYEKLYDLSELTEAEQNILEAFSVFPYIPLAAETCNQWLLADAGVSEDDDILMGLYQKGWLQFDWEQESYAMHPVFAQVIYEKCKPSVEKHHGLIESCQRYLEIPESGSVLECREYVSFAENILEKANIGKCEELVNFMDSLGYLLFYMADYRKAEELFKKGLRINERELREEYPSTVKIYSNLAAVYEEQGEYEKAEDLEIKSLRICEKKQGRDHLDTLRCYNNLAVVYLYQEKYEKAKDMLEKNLRMRKKIVGEEHADTANSYHNLAGMYADLGRYEKAEELYKKAIQIYEKVSMENHPDAAQVYTSLAYLYEEQEDYEKAKKLYEKSLRIKKNALGEKHLATATAYNNLGLLYEKLSEYEMAEELYNRGIGILESVLEGNHIDIAIRFGNLAGMYGKLGEYGKAKVLYEKSLKIFESVFGENHPDTIVIYNNLAYIYLCMQQDDYKKALDCCFKAYNISILKLGLDHPDTQRVYNNMKNTYSAWNPEGNYEQWLEDKMKGED